MTAYFSQYSGRRLWFGVLLSVLAHAVLIALPSGGLQANGKSNSVHALAVQLVNMPAEPFETKPDLPAPALLTRAVAKYQMETKQQQSHSAEVVVPAAKVQPEKAVNIEKEVTAAETPSSEVSGAIKFALPRSIGLPWAENMQLRPVQPHEKPVDLYREMHDREMAAQRQNVMIAQMGMTLTTGLAQSKLEANGRCTVFQTENIKLNCEPPALEELLRNNFSNLLNALFQVHDSGNGFEITIEQNKARISPIATPVK